MAINTGYRMTLKKTRGRPSKTSREDILEAACAQLKVSPFDELSLSALARSLGLSPMALYRYFGDKNELQQAIAERLMASITLEFVPGNTWQQHLQAWATGLREEFQKNPQLMQYMGWHGHIASAWIKQLMRLATMLHDAGIAETQLPMALKWISTSVIGLILVSIMRQRKNVLLDESDLPNDSTLATPPMPSLRSDVTNISEEELFEYHVQQLINCLEKDMVST